MVKVNVKDNVSVLKSVSEVNSKDENFTFTIFTVMKEFGLSPLQLFGGDLKIEGTIGDKPVSLKLFYPPITVDFFNSLVSYLEKKAELEEKELKKKK